MLPYQIFIILISIFWELLNVLTYILQSQMWHNKIKLSCKTPYESAFRGVYLSGELKETLMEQDFLDEMIEESTKRNPEFPSLMEEARQRRALLNRLADIRT